MIGPHMTKLAWLMAAAFIGVSVSGCFGGGSSSARPAVNNPPAVPAPNPVPDQNPDDGAAPDDPAHPDPDPQPDPGPQPDPDAGPRGVSSSADFTFTLDEEEEVVAFDLLQVAVDVAPGPNVSLTEEDGTIVGVTIETVFASIDGYSLSLLESEGAGIEVIGDGQVIQARLDGQEITVKTAQHGIDSDGNSSPSMSFNYLMFGEWHDLRFQEGSTEAGIGRAGHFVVGDVTANLPSEGTATYTGYAQGLYYRDSSGPLDTRANMLATVDFSERTVNFATSNTIVYDGWENGSPVIVEGGDFGLNMSGTLSYSPDVERFNGYVIDEQSRAGRADGYFFGPNAEEIGGTFRTQGDTSLHTGVFVGQKQ